MKCSVCGSENMIKIEDKNIGKYHVETYCCKSCCHIDSYCFDFKKKDLLQEKINSILNNIKTYRMNVIKNKKEALNEISNALNEMIKLFNSLNIKNELTDKYNELLTNINNEKNNLENYLDVNKLLHKEDETGFDDKGNPEVKEVYYVEDFPINFNDCVSGKNGLFFYLSKAKYRYLNAVKHHNSDTTVLDILDEYYQNEALNHEFFKLKNDLKNEDWFIKSSGFRELKQYMDSISNAIDLYNK